MTDHRDISPKKKVGKIDAAGYEAFTIFFEQRISHFLLPFSRDTESLSDRPRVQVRIVSIKGVRSIGCSIGSGRMFYDLL